MSESVKNKNLEKIEKLLLDADTETLRKLAPVFIDCVGSAFMLSAFLDFIDGTEEEVYWLTRSSTKEQKLKLKNLISFFKRIEKAKLKIIKNNRRVR